MELIMVKLEWHRSNLSSIVSIIKNCGRIFYLSKILPHLNSYNHHHSTTFITNISLMLPQSANIL